MACRGISRVDLFQLPPYRGGLVPPAQIAKSRGEEGARQIRIRGQRDALLEDRGGGLIGARYEIGQGEDMPVLRLAGVEANRLFVVRDRVGGLARIEVYVAGRDERLRMVGIEQSALLASSLDRSRSFFRKDTRAATR